MTEAVVSSVGQTIGNLLINEARFLWGVEGKVGDLNRELRLIRCLLRDADSKREHNEAVKECVAQLRDFAYDAEDVIERYILRVALNKGQNIIKAGACFMGKCLCLQVHEVGKEIEGLKSNISNLRTSMLAYGIQPVNEGECKCTRERTYDHLKEDFVGREDSIEELVKELLIDGKNHKVIFIWGMGGVGKTSLAKKVVGNDKVKNDFDNFAWVCVSQEYRVKDIFVEILVKLIPNQRERIMKMIDHELFETLYKIQQEKKCIVVLDDIWTNETWDSLRAAFPVEDSRSKLLITTRNKEVAQYIDPRGLFHELRCLSDLESWDLLKKRAFLETEELTENKKNIGDELLKKCGGLPLAVNVLGGLLAINEWETVYRNINLHFSDKSDVSKVLALSYDDLPWHLKPCFLYMGSFPTDEEIPATEILHMWIAEGFVSLNACDEERQITVEDVAEQYLMELVNRGMVQVRFNFSGKVKTCRLHDLMRELCISKSRQEGFLSNLNIRQDDEMEDHSSSKAIEIESTCKTRRLSLNMCVIGEGNTIPSVEQIGRTMLHLRTLVFFYSGEILERMWEQFRPIFINYKFLRVLKLEGLSMIRGYLPESVGDLVHLRFLSLAGSDLDGLPLSMGHLLCLEFLDLRGNKYINMTVPNVLWKMKRLRHLHLPLRFGVDGSKKLRLDSLKDLRTLKNFHLKNCDVNDVGKLINMRKLTILIQYGYDDLEIIPQLAKFTLKHLQSLSFRFKSGLFTKGELSKISSYCHSCKMSICGEIEKLPEHNNLPEQLRKLVLVNSKLEEDPMPILEKSNHLVVLVLSHAFVGREMICSAGGFLQLKHLVLVYLENLEQWKVAEGAMPHLSQLGIGECPKLEQSGKVPQGVYIYDSSGVIERQKNAVRQFKREVKIRDHAAVIRAARLIRMAEKGPESSRRVEKKKSKSEGTALDFVLGRTLCGRRGGEEDEKSDEEDLANIEVQSLEASEESSTNLCKEHETSAEGELCNNKVSLLEASEESSTNLA